MYFGGKMSESKYDLIMKNISKSFPGVKALDEVSFSAQKQKVAAIVGANGAGKSTLMKILSGVYDDYEGEISVDGVDCKMTNPIEAKQNGIMCVYQEVDTSLVPYLTVAENIFIDELALDKKKRFINWKKTFDRAKKIFEEMQVSIDEKKLVNDLTLADKQLVLIARAISMEIKFLILDEPTAPLSKREIDKLFELVNRLKNKGVGIIYISHRLNEVIEISDSVTVMKNGKVVNTVATKETSRQNIIQNMVGENFIKEFPKETVTLGDEIFRVENVYYQNKVNGVSFSIREGEILGIAGLVGAGKTELSKIVFGAEPMSEGSLYYKGKKIDNKSPYHAVMNGIALVPEERRKEGVLVDENVTRNLTVANLTGFSTYGFVDEKKEKDASLKMVQDLAVKTPSIDQFVKNLSGGNQQKIAVGKWLIKDADVYLMDEPTKGVDVGSKTEIFKLVGELVKKKKSIIYLSNEIEEIEGIADRVLVLYDGKIVKEMSREDMNLERILFYCTGGTDNG